MKGVKKLIIGNRTVIRQLEAGDEEFLYKWWNDNQLMEHATFPFGTMQSKEAIGKYVMSEIEIYDIFPPRKRYIICKKADMLPIGEINYADWDKRSQKCEFGIKICEIGEQGQGFGKDALVHFIDYLFKALNLNKIELTSMLDNQRAHKLYKQLGFKEIGTIREGCFDSRTGLFSDVMYMDLLKKEWMPIIDGKTND